MKQKFINVRNGISVSVPISEAQDFTERMHAETQGMNFDQLNNWIREQHYNYPTKIKPIPMTQAERDIIKFGDAEGRYADPGYSGNQGGGGAGEAGQPGSVRIPIWIPLVILFLMLVSLIGA